MEIRKRFTLLILFVVLLPLMLIGLGTYWFTYTMYQTQINDHMQDTLSAINLNMTTVLSEVEQFSSYLAASEQVTTYVGTDEWANPFLQVQYEEAASRLAFTNPYMYDFYLLSALNPDIYFIESPEERFSDLDASKFMDEVRSRRGSAYWIGPRDDVLEPSAQDFFVLGRSLRHPQTLHELGTMILLITPDILSDIRTLGENSDLHWTIVDPEGNTLFHSAPDRIDEQIDPNRIDRERGIYTNADAEEFLFTSTASFQDWELMAFKSVDSMNPVLYPARAFAAGIVVAIFLVLFFFHQLFSSRLISFIQKLKSAMTEAAEGNLGVRMPAYREAEFNSLSGGFNQMVEDLRITIEQIEQEQLEKRQAEFKVLQHQINPHFLYNTLDSISALASLNKPKEVQHMVTNLGKLLRISLKGPYEIPFSEELKHVTSYLEIQRIRYGNRFDFSVEVNDDVLDVPVLKLILQPLVENAIEHGSKSPAFSSIRIEAYSDKGTLVCRVSDDGPGFSPEVLSRINSFDDHDGLEGHGLLNVHHRLKLYYPETPGLMICSQPGDTVIQIRMLKNGMERKDGDPR